MFGLKRETCHAVRLHTFDPGIKWPDMKGTLEKDAVCWLCGRPFGRRIEWHHPKPKSRGGRTTVPVHPICHRTIHAHFTNAALARLTEDDASLRAHPDIHAFLTWIATKPPDFHAPTRRRRRQP